MKKYLLPILVLLLLAAAFPVFAESGLKEAAAAVGKAAALDEQLQLICDISAEYGEELETGGWGLGLTCNPAETIPDDLIPDLEKAEAAEMTREDFSGMKFIALHNECGTIRLLGDFQARLPEGMRAASIEEADAVLYLNESLYLRSDYIGSASNRNYDTYVCMRGSSKVTKICYEKTQPPFSGTGALFGEKLSYAELWPGAQAWFFGEIVLTYPEGTVTYRITGKSCALVKMDGTFVQYEVPAQINGYPVTAVQYIDADSLETLVLPEGIVTIDRIWAVNLKSLNFPSTLKSITDGIHGSGGSMRPVDLDFQEGLEEIGDFAVIGSSGITVFNWPSTLLKVGKGFLEYGLDVPSIVVPDGVERLPRYFLNDPGSVCCVYIPASVTFIGDTYMGRGNVRIYTPEGSYASQWAIRNGCPCYACASPEEMPVPVYGTEGDFKYVIIDGEAVLARYNGDTAYLRIPEQFGGCPVTEIMHEAIRDKYWLRVLILPDTVRRIAGNAITYCNSLEAVYIPASVTDYVYYSVNNNESTVYAPEGSAIFDLDKFYAAGRAVWEPGAEEAWSYLEKIGTFITFGTYEQDGDESNGPEPVEWQVLDYDTESGRALVLSRYGLDTKPCNDTKAEVTWENCTLRAWLNDEFLNTAFSEEEQKAILLTDVDNSESQCCSEWDTTGGNDTRDRIFLLSYAEANRYLDAERNSNNMKPRTSPTEYAKKQGAWQGSDYYTQMTPQGIYGGEWRLRSPGYTQYQFASIRADGSVSFREAYTSNNIVRPVMWLDLSGL